MKQLHISLFGKLCMLYGGQVLTGCKAYRVQELFCYLLINRDRPHAREMLASLLWGDHCTTSQSKKYLRHALWRLQVALSNQPELAGSGLLLAEPEWIELHSVAGLWLDVAIFEEAYDAVKGIPGQDLDDHSAKTLERAVRLYKGFLLGGWYQDWCLCERERLHQIYLIMLDKLMGYCEVHQKYEIGLSYGRLILRYDSAREHTHQQMMRLYYLDGCRTDALRQYEHCVAALKEELDVEPSRSTVALYEQIRDDQPFRFAVGPEWDDTVMLAISKMHDCLQQLQASVVDVQQQVQRAARLNAPSRLRQSASFLPQVIRDRTPKSHAE